jgi:hypothetical protein
MRADSLTSPVLWLRLDLDHGPYRDTKAGPEQMVRVGELRDRPDLLHHLVEVVAARDYLARGLVDFAAPS